MKTDIYNAEAKKTGSIDLPENIFSVELKNDLIHQVVTSMMSNQRYNTAHTKDRSEVSGGGRKPWKQKGTGRARHGSSRSPIWVGGGVTFGPRNERNFSKKINKKSKNQALFSILSEKYRNNQILFVDSIALEEAKTKKALNVLQNLSSIEGYSDLLSKKKNSALILNTEINENNTKSFANFSNLKLEEFRKLNPIDLLKYKYLIIINPEESVKLLEDRKS